MRITRRQLAGLVAAVPAAARGLAADPAAGRRRAAAATPQAAAGPDFAAQPATSAADDLRKNAATIRKLAVPAQTEPAFSFRAQ